MAKEVDPYKQEGWLQDYLYDYAGIGGFKIDDLLGFPEAPEAPGPAPVAPAIPAYGGYQNDARQIWGNNPYVAAYLTELEAGGDPVEVAKLIYDKAEENDQLDLLPTDPQTNQPGEQALVNLGVSIAEGDVREQREREQFANDPELAQQQAAYDQLRAEWEAENAAYQDYEFGSNEWEQQGSPGVVEMAQQIAPGMDPLANVRTHSDASGGPNMLRPEVYREILAQDFLPEMYQEIQAPTRYDAANIEGTGGPVGQTPFVGDAPFNQFTSGMGINPGPAQTTGRIGSLGAPMSGVQQQITPEDIQRVASRVGDTVRVSNPAYQVAGLNNEGNRDYYEGFLDREADKPYRVQNILDRVAENRIAALQGNRIPSGREREMAQRAEFAASMFGGVQTLPPVLQQQVASVIGAGQAPQPLAQQAYIPATSNPAKYKQGPSTAAATIEEMRRNRRR